MALIDDLNRLNRAGSEDSRTTQKLSSACRDLADHISDDVIGFPCELPRRSASGTVFQQYSVVLDEVNNKWLAVYVEPDDGFYDGHNVICKHWGRDRNLAFAKDVANGLVSAISDWLEQRAAESEKYADIVATELPTQSIRSNMLLVAAGLLDSAVAEYRETNLENWESVEAYAANGCNIELTQEECEKVLAVCREYLATDSVSSHDYYTIVEKRLSE
jgi:hypothetical protein